MRWRNGRSTGFPTAAVGCASWNGTYSFAAPTATGYGPASARRPERRHTISSLEVGTVDFSAHLHRLEHVAMEVKAVELVFYSGRRFSMEPERLKGLYWKYGTLRRIRYLPENEAALVRTIMMEHRYQKGWTPKKDRAPPSGPIR